MNLNKFSRCDFPRQLCMRAADLYKEEKANECRNLPEDVSPPIHSIFFRILFKIKCLVAANGGEQIPQSQKSVKTTSSPLLGQFPNIPKLVPSVSVSPKKNSAPNSMLQL